MASEVSICNRALSRVGAKTISAFTDASAEARECSLHYPLERDDLLAGFPWVFARQRTALAEVTNDRSDQWSYAYQMPTGLLNIEWVNDPDLALALIRLRRPPSCKYELAGSTLYANVEDAWIEFTKETTDPNLFPVHFSTALSFKVAEAICLQLTQQDRRMAATERKAEIEVSKAMALDADLEPHHLPDLPNSYTLGRVVGENYAGDE